MGPQSNFLAGGMENMMGRGMGDMGGHMGGPPPLPGCTTAKTVTVGVLQKFTLAVTSSCACRN